MLALLMGLAAAVTVATVVRLGLVARHDEIEIMERRRALTYIRWAIVAEGFLQGGIGAVLAILFLWLSHAVANAWWGTELRALFEGEAPRFLPVRLHVSDPGRDVRREHGGLRLPGGPAPTRVDITSLTWLDFSKLGEMPALRNRLSRFLTDSPPPCDRVLPSLSNFYREEFILVANAVSTRSGSITPSARSAMWNERSHE